MVLKRNLQALGFTGLLALTGCGTKANSNMIAEAEENLRGGPKILEISLGAPRSPVKKIIKFYDDDGNGDDVERYMEFYSDLSGMPVNDPLVNLERSSMTPGQKEFYDTKYREVLGRFN